MSYSVFSIPPFDRQLKRLAKKYPSLKNDFINLVNTLKENPVQGTPLGRNCYKIRLAITSKGKGKSGGGRIISNIVVADQSVYLLAIYDKAAQESIADDELSKLLKKVP